MNRRVALGLAWGVVLTFGVIPPLLQAGIPDVAWPIYLAERVLGGARHGVSFFEVNPPLFIWLKFEFCWVLRCRFW